MKIKEFRSISEASPRVLYALQDALGATAGELKKMSQAGELTTQVVSGALIKNLTLLRIESEKMGPSIGEGFNILKNSLQTAVGRFDQATGASRAFGGFLRDLGNSFIDIAKSATESGLKIKSFLTENATLVSNVTKTLGYLVVGWASYKTAVFAAEVATKAFAATNVVLNLMVATYVGIQTAIKGVIAATVFARASTVAFGATQGALALIQGLWVAIRTGVVAYTAAMPAATAAAAGFSAAATGGLSIISQGLIKIAAGALAAGAAFLTAKTGLDLLNDSQDSSAQSDLVEQLKKERETQLAGIKATADAAKRGLTDQAKLRADLTARSLTALKQEYEGQKLKLAGDKEGLKLLEATYKQRVLDEQLRQKQGDALITNNGAAVETEATKKLREERERLAEQNAEFRKNYLAETELLKSVNAFIAQGLPLKEAELAAQRKVDEQKAISAGLTKQQVAEQYALRDAIVLTSEAEKIIADTYKEINDEKIKGMEASKKALEDFLKPEDFKVGDLFGDASKGAGALINAFQDIIKQQEDYAKIRDGIYETEIQRKDALAKADKKQAQNEIRNIGNILGATKGFFKEKSAGYKVLSAAEKAFRIFEIAEAVKAFAIKKLFTAEEIALHAAGTATKEGVETGFTAFTVIQKGIQATASGIAALASSMAGLPFPLNLAAFAATGALLASIGLSLGGGSKAKGSFAPTNEGTGTVFGDKSAKSESIKRSIDLLAENSKIELPITSAMLRSLQNIEANIGGLTNLVIRGGAAEDLANTVSTGFKESGLGKGLRTAVGIVTLGASEILGIGKLIGGLFGTKISIKGQGLLGEAQNLSSITSDGFNLREYVDINKKKKSFGFTTSNKNSTKTSAASDELERQFTLIFTNFYDAIKLAAVPLDQNLNEVTSRLDNFVVNIGKIDLKGLKGSEIQEKLEAVFGAAADSIAQAAIPGLEDFQKVGEGYFETVVRVSSGIEQAAQALRQFGVAAVNFKDVINKQGNVSVEIVRQSLLAKEIAQQTTVRQTGSVVVSKATQAEANKAIQDVINSLTASGFKNIVVTPDLVTTTTQEFVGNYNYTISRALGTAAKAAQQIFGDTFTGLITHIGRASYATVTSVSGEIDFAYNVINTKLTGIGEIIKSFTGDSVDELVELVKELYNLRDLQKGFGVVVSDVSVAMIQAAGSFDAFKDGVTSFYENFTTPQEKIASQTNILAREFARLGLQLPATRDAYKNLVLTAANNTSVAGQEMYGSLIRLSPLFVELQEALDDVGGSAEEVGASLNDVAKNLYKTIAEARQKSLTPVQSIDFLLGEFRSSQAAALASSGKTLATTAEDLNSQINPLLEAIKNVYASGSTAQTLIDEVLGGAKAVADRAATEAFTYQDESLRLLQAQVNELEAIRAAIQGGTYSPQNIVASKMGNAFYGGNVVPFAKGGMFTNSIVSRPTLAPMALFGEATPEAIMPLARGSDGSLGVRIVGGGNSSAGVEAKLEEGNRQAAALVRLQQAANQKIIEKLSMMEERLDGLESAARLEAAS